jgi:hypothetical protein
MKVVITPCAYYVPGMVQRILGDIGSGPVVVDEAGKVHAELNPGQLEMFKLKGAAHHIQVVPETETTPILDAPATFPEPEAESQPELTITIETAPGVRTVHKVGPTGLEPIPEANTPVAVPGSQDQVEGSQKTA